MNSNRLSRLPTWVGKMKHLRILKLENNPLEWPPPHVSRMPTVTLPRPPSSGSSAVAEREIVRKFEDRQMVVWIAKLRNWINDNQRECDFIHSNGSLSTRSLTRSVSIG